MFKDLFMKTVVSFYVLMVTCKVVGWASLSTVCLLRMYDSYMHWIGMMPIHGYPWQLLTEVSQTQFSYYHTVLSCFYCWLHPLNLHAANDTDNKRNAFGDVWFCMSVEGETSRWVPLRAVLLETGAVHPCLRVWEALSKQINDKSSGKGDCLRAKRLWPWHGWLSTGQKYCCAWGAL